LAISKAELKKLASLKTKKGRNSENRFMAEGVRVLEEALKFDFHPIKLFFSQADISERGQEIVRQFKLKKIEIIAVSSKEIDTISDTESAQGVAAVFNVPESKLSKLYKSVYRKVLLCDRINDPGNLGTLVRTALAFEFDMIIVTENTVEIFSPKVVRASAGAIFGLPTARASCQELKQFKMSKNIKVAATVAPHDIRGKNYETLELELVEKFPFILAVGSEAEGLSEEILCMTDYAMTIRHNSKVESLNAAVAGAILMHDIYEKQRRQAGE
jgi:TrmH family RNA methyltransferase